MNLFKAKEQPQVKPGLKLQSTYVPPKELFDPTNVHEWMYYIKKEANKNLEVSI